MKKIMGAALMIAAGFTTVVQADNGADMIEKNLKKIDARIQVKSIGDAPISGMHEVELQSGEVVYSDSKGEYFLIGKLYQFTDKDGFVNLTEKKQSAQRKEQIAAIPEEQMVIYPAEGELKATVNIFTDIDCPYCRKLHDEVPALTKMGVQVNYLAFPRNGAGTATYKNMVSIWCAEGGDKRREAMDVAKNGGNPEAKSCENPVMDQLALGQVMGVTGTPAMVLEDGRLLPGYVPAAQLGKILGLK